MSEAQEKKKFRRYIRDLGHIVQDFVGERDNPDLIVLTKCGRVVFFEFKYGKGKLRRGQAIVKRELEGMGFSVFIPYSFEEAKRQFFLFLNGPA